MANCRLVKPGPLFEEAAHELQESSMYQKWKRYFRIFKNKNHATATAFMPDDNIVYKYLN